MPDRAKLWKAVAAVSAALVIGGIPLWLAGDGLGAYFTNDDTTNLYGYWTKPWRDLVVANLAYWSPFYRPLGGVFYRSLFAAFGFDPFPFRVVSFAIMLVNLALWYATASTLAGSREAGLLAALIGCYHAGFDDLYYNTGTIYDLLCFSFYAGALLVYARIRSEGRRPRPSEAILLAAFYVCALNAKEMAVTLPPAILIYEWVYHRPGYGRRELLGWIGAEARFAWFLAVLTVPYLHGKLSEASAFSGVGDYQQHISLERYVSTYGHYLDRMFYQEPGRFTWPAVLLLCATMLAVAWLSRRRAPWFGFLFVLVSVLPVIFIPPRGTIFVLYIPFLGWSLYAAELLIFLRSRLARLWPAFTGMRAVTFAALAAVLVLAHKAHTPVQRPENVLRPFTKQMQTLMPRVAAGSRILFLDDPFSTDEWTPLFLIRLAYGDNTIQVDRGKTMKRPPDPGERKNYDAILTYRDGRLLRAGDPRTGSGRVRGAASCILTGHLPMKLQTTTRVDRRSFLTAVGGGMAALPAAAQIRRDWSGRNPVRYPDPDIVAIDPRFSKYKIGNTPIQRLHTGTLWAEGPAWSGVGRYLVWSDIPNNIQLRWLEEDGHVSVFRNPAGNSNGNTFDWEGRQISCEHGNRRVVRYEPNGKVTVLADQWQGKPLNAPNDAVVHPDGGIWFTDPGYGSLLNYEGNKGALELKEAVYRIDSKTAKMDMVTDEIFKPNGLCFSPDYKKLYVADTGATHYSQAPRNVKVWDVADVRTLRNGREFASMELAGKGAGLADGIRADVDGNVWVGAGWVGEGYDGVHAFAPDGQRIGMILLPEICSNICFGGTKRNRLFMTGSQSLYAVYVETQGAHIT